jgi:hypothetical protein
VKDGTDVVCVAKNSAVLEGLLCVFHAERSTGNGLLNTQNELPLLSDWDKQCIAVSWGPCKDGWHQLQQQDCWLCS